MTQKRDYKIEVCVVSYEQAISAADHGADRLELCSRLETEGMTPDLGLTEQILHHVNIPVRIMIRETEEGFESDEHILEKMKSSIRRFKSLPVEAFVIGLLKNNCIDRDAMHQLIEECSPFPVTVHKAIDHSQDVMDDIIWLNQFATVDTILTSGGKTTAVEGIDMILKMKSIFRKEIMGAGKITNDQLPLLHQQLQLNWYHGRAII